MRDEKGVGWGCIKVIPSIGAAEGIALGKDGRDMFGEKKIHPMA